MRTPRYTTEDMLRDMIIPIMIGVVFISIWSAIAAIEARALHKSFWSCFIGPCEFSGNAPTDHP